MLEDTEQEDPLLVPAPASYDSSFLFNSYYLVYRFMLPKYLSPAQSEMYGENNIRESLLLELACAHCGQTFLSRRYLIEHVFNHFSDISSPLFICIYCCKLFEDLDKLHLYKYTYRNSQGRCSHYIPYLKQQCSFMCNICGKSFKIPIYLRKHKRIHMNKQTYRFEVCGKSFNYSKSLAPHKRIHTGKKTCYACEVCGKVFGRSNNLARHKRGHMNEHPYSCEICGKLFKDLSNLSAYKRIHTGERPYVCKICGKTFLRSNHLIVHERVNTGEQLYICEVCGKLFSVSSALVKHKKLI